MRKNSHYCSNFYTEYNESGDNKCLSGGEKEKKNNKKIIKLSPVKKKGGKKRKTKQKYAPRLNQCFHDDNGALLLCFAVILTSDALNVYKINNVLCIVL